MRVGFRGETGRGRVAVRGRQLPALRGRKHTQYGGGGLPADVAAGPRAIEAGLGETKALPYRIAVRQDADRGRFPMAAGSAKEPCGGGR